MNKNSRPHAFTLIEVLIVVVIMAVLAALIIPQYTNTSDDAKKSTLKSNLHIMRSQIELYRMDHLAKLPTIQNNDLPQLTHATNSNGETGAPGPGYPHGPYIVAVPKNPFDDSNKVTAVETSGEPPTSAAGNLGGWQYDGFTGDIWPNHPEYFE